LAYPDLHFYGYCDDLYMVGPPELAIDAYKRWKYVIATRIQGSLRDEKGKVFSSPPDGGLFLELTNKHDTTK